MPAGPIRSVVGDDIHLEIYPDLLSSNRQKLVGAIDQGTSSTRFVLFTQHGDIAASAQTEHAQIYPQPGWHEHDPAVLWRNTAACLQAVLEVPQVKAVKSHIAAIGITNQRETTLAWNLQTGEPYYNAIVWDDTRTQDIAAQIGSRRLTATTGLPASSYFAGTKVKWLLDHVDALRTDLATRPDQVRFGTVDTWLLYQLTGHASSNSKWNTGGIVETDVTNASRWLFLNLHTVQWDRSCIDKVCAPHRLPTACLPTIRPSSHVFGTIAPDCGVPSAPGIPLAAVLGDQQAALFGQAAYSPGHAKNTYGTGLFLMLHTGTTPVPSRHGLLTTIAYQGSDDGSPVMYALEGSVSHSGATIQWLRDQLQIIDSAAASETEAQRTTTTSTTADNRLYFVPAFSGLLAPHWRPDARACMVGLTTAHHKGHVCRAALEATCFQTQSVFAAMEADMAQHKNSKTTSCLTELKVDGGGTQNKWMMQFQADLLGVPVVQPRIMETTSLGAALAAGLAVGVWKDTKELEQLLGGSVQTRFEPCMSASEREECLAGWNKAVSKSLGWVGEEETKSGSKSLLVWAGVVAGACAVGVVLGRLTAAKK